MSRSERTGRGAMSSSASSPMVSISMKLGIPCACTSSNDLRGAILADAGVRLGLACRTGECDGEGE